MLEKNNISRTGNNPHWVLPYLTIIIDSCIIVHPSRYEARGKFLALVQDKVKEKC